MGFVDKSMKKTLIAFTILMGILVSGCKAPDKSKDSEGSPTPNGKASQSSANKKPASETTIQANKAVRDFLPFEDTTDFANARKGFIATIESGEIKDSAGNVVYSMKQYDFLKQDAPTTTNPSLWRQSQLNSMNGLFEVQEGIYQIRGFDLANMTLVKGKTGWIIIDVLTTQETAKSAMELVDEKLGKFPVKAVLITHSHIDHFGGIRGVVSEEEVKSGKVKIFAPKEYFEHSVSENVMAGNTMGRRASYMYGNLLPKDTTGTLGTGLGQTTSSGMAGVMEATDIISSLEGETKTIDGLKVEFFFAPESEAPSEMMFYFPAYKALCESEDISHTQHNLYTLRGAQVRNGQKWSKYIDMCIEKWGDEVETTFGSHHWPVWGNEAIVDFWEKQRDLYRFMHDQTLRMANQGYTPKEIAEIMKMPDGLTKEFYNRGYYGTISHNVKSQYQLYFGWFDGNPANLNPLPPAEAGKKYVEFMGGADELLDKAQKAYDAGDYRWTAEVVNHLVFADPSNQKAKNLMADAFEQMGYQAESGPWRNFYLTGAQELREGVKKMPTIKTAGPDMVRGMDTELYFNFIAMRFKGTDEKASSMDADFNIFLSDVNEKATLLVSNGTVTPRVGSHLSSDVTATITIKRSDLDRVNLGETSMDELMTSGAVTIDGDAEAFKEFLSHLDTFEFWFNIVEP